MLMSVFSGCIVVSSIYRNCISGVYASGEDSCADWMKKMSLAAAKHLNADEDVWDFFTLLFFWAVFSVRFGLLFTHTGRSFGITETVWKH